MTIFVWFHRHFFYFEISHIAYRIVPRDSTSRLKNFSIELFYGFSTHVEKGNRFFCSKMLHTKEKNHLRIMNGHHSIISELVSESSKSIMQFMKVFLHSTCGHVATPDYFSFLSICGERKRGGLWERARAKVKESAAAAAALLSFFRAFAGDWQPRFFGESVRFGVGGKLGGVKTQLIPLPPPL